ncbi:MAG: RNA-binding S4 domain-containing protein [Nitrosomonas sp.]|nr:RNA-binding S4 domain-containing protein [Nitrosomonas sp.]
MIAKGKVKVDGQVELRKTCKIRNGQVVEYARERITVTP